MGEVHVVDISEKPVPTKQGQDYGCMVARAEVITIPNSVDSTNPNKGIILTQIQTYKPSIDINGLNTNNCVVTLYMNAQ